MKEISTRCLEQIVVNHNEKQCKITFRKIPAIAGDSLAAATDERLIQFTANGNAVTNHSS